MSDLETHVVWKGDATRVEKASLPVLSDGVLYGFGCFETMTWNQDTGVRFWTAHCHRIKKAAKTLGLKWSPPKESLINDWARELASHHQISSGTARLSLHKAENGVEVLFRLFQRPAARSDKFRLQTSRYPHPGPSPISSHKHNNYILNLLALQEARQSGYDEALLCRDGEIIEGAVSNLFVWMEDALRTPPLSSGPLSGIIRQRLLANAAANTIQIREARIYQSDLPKIKAIFITNAARLVQQVETLDDHVFDTSQYEDLHALLETMILSSD